MQTFLINILLPTLSVSYVIVRKILHFIFGNSKTRCIFAEPNLKKMKRDNIFLKIAEKISLVNCNYGVNAPSIFICNDLLHSGHCLQYRWFDDTFKPTKSERIKYSMCDEAWLGSWKDRNEYNNNEFRILVCCMADILWNEHLQNGH